jgi:4-hydroxy-tetrahydrodipicolinate reductase
VLYSGFWSDADLFCRLLESGVNVATQVGAVFMRSSSRRRSRIEDACAAGGSTFFVGGINTGFFSDRLAAELTTLNGEVSHLQVVEYSPGSLTGLSEYMIFDAMGFGWTQERLDRERPALFGTLNDSAMFAGGDFLGAALGFTVDARDATHEFLMARRDIEAYGRIIRAGEVAAVQTTYSMSAAGVERVRYSQAWTIDKSVKTGWPYESHPKAFYQLRITGKPSYNMFWEPDGDGMHDALYSTAATVVNAIPFICDAAPGIQTQIDLPMISFSGELR